MKGTFERDLETICDQKETLLVISLELRTIDPKNYEQIRGELGSYIETLETTILDIYRIVKAIKGGSEDEH